MQPMLPSDQSAPTTLVPADLVQGGGELGALMRGLDWAKTPLGPLADWPQSLRAALSICLNSRFPIAIYWGPELALLYNDAWSPIPGKKHPWALGRPAREVWPEIWNEIGPLFDAVQQTGEGVWQHDQLLPMHRHGYTEECYFNFTFSPIPGEQGGVAGIFNAVIETTFRVLEERRARMLRELAERTTGATSALEVCRRAADVLQASLADVPFCLVYLSEQADGPLQLAATAGAALPASLCPPSIDAAAAASPWPVAEALGSSQLVVLDQLSARFGLALSSSVWPEPVECAVLASLGGTQPSEPRGLLILGVSPRRALDETYQTFMERLRLQIATALSNAHSYAAERRRAEALAEIDRAKTQFFANVSHEFRTPLTLLLGPLEEVLQQADGALAPPVRAQLDVAHRNGLRLLRMVNTLLDFSRSEAGRNQALYVPTDLARFTAELASVFRSAIERAGLQLIVDCPPLNEPVYVDHELWEKIVFNLLSNAFKFTFAGEIAVALRQVGTHVELSIRDTGTGIPPDELPQLFARFHRVRGARGRSIEGSGIGLALVQELVQLHGGSVRAESTVDVGSTFIVSIPRGNAHLPAERIGPPRLPAPTDGRGEAYVAELLRWLPDAGIDDQRSQTPATLQSASPTSRPVIVLADDNADMRAYVERLLGETYTVIAVADGAAALQVVREQPCDLVLSDVMMPRLDGFALLAALRADERTKTLPVILLSARAGEAAHVEGMASGADDYLIKPFSANELRARVAAHLKLQGLRREATAALQASEARLLAFMEHSPGSLFIKDAAGRYLVVNQAFLQAAGKPADAVIGKTDAELFPPALVDVFVAEDREVLTSGQARRFEDTFVYAGQRYTFLSHKFPLPGGSLGSIGTDISEQKQTEERLRRLQQVTSRFAETQTLEEVRQVILRDVLRALDASDGGLRRVMPHGLVVEQHELSTPADEASLRRYSVVSLDEQHPAVEVVRTGQPVCIGSAEQIIARYPSLADVVTQRGIQAMAHLPLARGDEVFGVLSMTFVEPRAWDEAEQRFALALADRAAVAYERARLYQAERRARALSERLQAVAAALSSAATPVEVYAAVLSTDDEGRGVAAEADVLTTRSVALYVLEGDTLVRADRIGSDTPLVEAYRQFPLSATIPAAEAVRDAQPIWLRSKADYARHYPHLASEIQLLGSEAAASLPLVVEGRVLGGLNFTFVQPLAFDADERGFLLALADLCAQALERSRLLEAEQAARKEAEAASRLKDEFLATVSHELRTPLTAFLGYAQLLQTRKRDEAYVARTVEKLVRSAKDQAQLIEDLLDVSRIVTGNLRLEPQPLDLRAVVAAALDTVRPAIEAKQHHFLVDLGSAATPINGDAARLQQVVWNLLSNAVKFTPPNGTIEVQVQSHQGTAQLTVSDTGQGISEDFLPFVFDRFRQADSTRQRFHGGLGLGLSIVRHLVELHGGSVQVRSGGSGQGSTFVVRLPLLSDKPNAPTGPQDGVEAAWLPCPPEVAGMRVLVVDDQHDILELVQELLTECGAVVKPCDSAEAALAALSAWRPDLLIADIGMPRADGYWLIGQVRALPAAQGGATPAVALTAYVGEEERLRAVQAGFQHYLPKPVVPSDLLAVVASLGRRATPDEQR
jgi:PAS domain S-box-containing protein